MTFSNLKADAVEKTNVIKKKKMKNTLDDFIMDMFKKKINTINTDQVDDNTKPDSMDHFSKENLRNELEEKLNTEESPRGKLVKIMESE